MQKNLYKFNKKEHKSFKIIQGDNKIIISAPHSTIHKREDSIRSSETRTGHLVRKISKHSNIYGIYKNKAELNDANWDKVCHYKQAIIDMVKDHNIKALIDIHGMAAHRKQDICIGINNGKNINQQYNIVENMISIFKKYGFKNISIDEPFAAANEYCVSTYTAKKCGILAFQIEINRKYRSAKYKEFIKYNDLEKALIAIVKMLIEDI